MVTWGVQLAKFIWFRPFEDPFVAPSLYETLVGEKPDSSQSNRVLNQAQPYHSVAAGNSKGTNYTAAIQPGRFELQLAKIDTAPGVPASWLLDEALALASALAEKAASAGLEKTSRVAINVLANVATNSQPESASIVQDAMGYKLPLKSPTDLTFQVNQRRSSAVASDLLLNRIINLSSTVVQQFSMSLPAGPGSTGHQVTAMLTPIEQHFANMQIDVNTVPTGREYDASEQLALLQEITAEAFGIARQGSIMALTK